MFLSTCAAQQCTNGVVGVLTGQYDNRRDSVNSNETCLTPQTGTFYAADGVTPIFVQKAAFPTLISNGTESPIYAQPLYAPNVLIESAKHNVIYLAALNDVVYAYDADHYGSGSPPSGQLYWSTSLIANCTQTSGGTTYPGAIVKLTPGPGVLLPYLGVVSTPVIDAEAGIIYVVNACQVTNPKAYGAQWYLNALNITTGKPAVPAVQIAGGVTNAAGTTVFTPDYELQRSALLLTRDGAGASEIYIAFGALTVEGADQAPYHGWLFGYALNSGGTALVQQMAFTATPTSSVFSSMCDSVISDGYPLPPNWCGEAGGIWMSGRGPAAADDEGGTDIFLAVSNGGFQMSAPRNWGESVLKFPAGTAASPTDAFTPTDWYLDENENDEDMGTSGVVLFDGVVNGATRHFLVVTDKAGNLFLLAPEHLGGFHSPDNAIQEFLASSSIACQQTNDADSYCNEPHSLVYWNSTLYMWPMASPLRAFPFSNGTFVETPLLGAQPEGFPGGMLAISSNGATNGILWALSSNSTYNQKNPGTLTAFDPNTLAALWSSTDTFLLPTFGEATVVNGRVYVPTNDHGLLVYANH